MNAQSSKTEQGSSLDSMHNSARTDSPEDIEQQAADWLLRLDTDQGPSQAELKRLRAWVERSPAHREQFKRLTQYWHCTTLPADLSFSPANSSESEATKATSVSAFQRLFSSGWRGTAILGTALSLTAALAMGLLMDNSSGISGNGIYETRTGEQNSITLVDGSVIQLNTGSRIHVNFVDNQRTVSLMAGEVHFEVAKDTTRPFIVKAREGLVRAVGTAFTVRLQPQALKVVVAEGKVALATSLDKPNSDNNTAETVKRAVDRGYLVEGQTVDFVPEADKGLGNEIQQLKQDDLDQQLAWRRGMLLFAGEPLSEVIAEVNRYTSIDIKIIDAQIADIRIGGHFKVDETDAMLQALEMSFGIQVTRPSDNTVHLALK
ncbi:MAG: FecR family protein [Porticoccaceae bacterium]